MASADPGLAGSWIALLSIVLLLVLLGLSVRLLRRGPTGLSANGEIQVLAVRSIGPRDRIVVVRIQNRCFALGHTSTHISVIAELDGFETHCRSNSPEHSGLADQFRKLLNIDRS